MTMNGENESDKSEKKKRTTLRSLWDSRFDEIWRMSHMSRMSLRFVPFVSFCALFGLRLDPFGLFPWHRCWVVWITASRVSRRISACAPCSGRSVATKAGRNLSEKISRFLMILNDFEWFYENPQNLRRCLMRCHEISLRFPPMRRVSRKIFHRSDLVIYVGLPW